MALCIVTDCMQHWAADCQGVNPQHSSETGHNTLITKKEEDHFVAMPDLGSWFQYLYHLKVNLLLILLIRKCSLGKTTHPSLFGRAAFLGILHAAAPPQNCPVALQLREHMCPGVALPFTWIWNAFTMYLKAKMGYILFPYPTCSCWHSGGSSPSPCCPESG